jgi:hypothetical protein
MDRRRMALVAAIAAQWLAIIGSVLLVRGLLLGGHLGHLTAGGISLALAVVVGAFVLSLAGVAAKPIWDVRLSRE